MTKALAYFEIATTARKNILLSLTPGLENGLRAEPETLRDHLVVRDLVRQNYKTYSLRH